MASSRAVMCRRGTGHWAAPIGKVRLHRYSSSTASQEVRHYLQDGIIPMSHFQRSLPRLPVPKLEATCERYLASQRAILDNDAYAEHAQLVEDFRNGQGKKLHEQLIEHNKANKHTSYITDFWFDMYLKARDPLLLTYNPFLAFTDDIHPGFDDQACRAATIIASAVRFMKTYRAAKLEPDMYHLNGKKTDNERIKKRLRLFPQIVSWYGAYLHKVFPLDMSQYPRLFNSTRIPRKGKDTLVTDESGRHIVVIRNGRFFAFDVVHADGTPVDVSDIHRRIKNILSNEASTYADSVACLTSEDRDTWAGVRSSLEASPHNAKVLKEIDSAVFVLCLDDKQPQTVDEIIRVFLHGQAHNRWFDKSFQLIVCRGGKAAINFEHAWGDGVAVLRFMNEVYRDLKENPVNLQELTTGDDHVRELTFNVDSSTRQAIGKARQRFDTTVNSLSLRLLQYHGMNRDYLRKKKIGADALFQLALQMAFHRQYGFVPATYESCSTAAFKHGRTETIRPATTATAACVAAFERTHPAGVEEMKSLVDAASTVHNKLIKEAAMGQGFDRHLFALRQLAGEQSVPFFTSAPYQSINHIVLSTSTLSSPSAFLGGFGPVVGDGFGVGYRADEDFLGMQVTAYPARDPQGFVQALESSFHDLQSIFEGRNFKS